MANRHLEEDQPGLDGPDYVTLLIEWDNVADELERGTTAAPSTTMPTKDSDWIIDEAGLESFPASDPPAWGSSRAAAPVEIIEPHTKKIRSKKRLPILLGVIGLFALTGFLTGRALLHRR